MLIIFLYVIVSVHLFSTDKRNYLVLQGYIIANLCQIQQIICLTIQSITKLIAIKLLGVLGLKTIFKLRVGLNVISYLKCMDIL